MEKRRIPEGAEAIVTYKWDFERGEYVLVKREPVGMDAENQEDQREDATAQ